MVKRIKTYYLAILWAILVFIACLLPPSDRPNEESIFFEGFDKLAHTGFLFILTILLFYGKLKTQQPYHPALYLVKIIVLTSIFGGSIELLQWKIFTYRSAEWWDFICDMLGVGMAVFSYLFITKPLKHAS